MEHNKISQDFRFGSLLRFALPTIAMMLMMSIYSMVDGIFVARFVGTNAFSAVNIIYPITFLVIGMGIMLGTGSSAVIARKLGAGRDKEAREDLTLIVVFGFLVSVVFSLLGLLFRDGLITMLGANAQLMEDCRMYFTITALGFPAFVLQVMFQTLFVTAGKPQLGLLATVGAGITNVVLDYVFIVPMGMGVAGAALATLIGYCIPAVVGLVFFFPKRSSKRSNLYFVRPKWRWDTLWKSCTNGSSEMVTNLASAVISILFNVIMMGLLGADGVAAIGIVLYGQFLFTAIFLGFSSGVAPVISYNYGAQNIGRLQRVVRICMIFIPVVSCVILAASLIFAPWVVAIFAPREGQVYSVALEGFLVFSLNYLFAGVNIYASSMFTAFSNGKVSALISFLRTFGLILPVLLLLPQTAGIVGVWLAVPISEAVCMAVSIGCLVWGKKKYQYSRKAVAAGDPVTMKSESRNATAEWKV